MWNVNSTNSIPGNRNNPITSARVVPSLDDFSVARLSGINFFWWAQEMCDPRKFFETSTGPRFRSKRKYWMYIRLRATEKGQTSR